MTNVSVSVGYGGRYVPITFIIMGLCMIVAGLFFTYDTFNRIENWAKVEGTVVDAKAVENIYDVEVTYVYEFDGKMYQSTISIIGSSSGLAAKTKEAASYVIGSRRKLSVNPSNPPGN